MARDAGISFHGIARPTHARSCTCSRCEALRQQEAEAAELARLKALAAQKKEEQLALRQRCKAEAVIADLAGIAVVGFGGAYWFNLFIYYLLVWDVVSDDFRTAVMPMINTFIDLQTRGMGVWAMVLIFSGIPMWVLSAYAGSELHYERRRVALANQKLRRLTKKTLADGRRLAMEQRRR